MREIVDKLLDAQQPISERFRALFSIRNVPGEISRSALITAMRDPSNLLAHEAAFALGQMQDEQALAALRHILSDVESAHPIVRHEAAEAIGAIGDLDSVPLLRRSLQLDPAREVRETCELALHRIQQLQQQKIHKKLQKGGELENGGENQKLWKGGENQEAENENQKLQKGGLENGDENQKLQKQEVDENEKRGDDPRLQKGGLENGRKLHKLGEYQEAENGGKLELRNGDEEQKDGKSAAAQVIPKFLSVDPILPASADASVNDLRESLLDESLGMHERYAALFALRNRGGEEATGAIVAALGKSESALLKHEVAYVLGQLQDRSSVEALIRCLEDEREHPMVRHEAAEALGSIADPKCLELLERFAGDPEPIVHESCQVALTMLEFERQGKPFDFLFRQLS